MNEPFISLRGVRKVYRGRGQEFLAVAGAIVGEFLGSDRGLGYLMLQVQVTLDTAAMFMAVILITLIGMVLYGIVLGLERLLVVRDARIA